MRQWVPAANTYTVLAAAIIEQITIKYIATSASNTMAQTHFGFKTVDENEKAKQVRGVFDSVASKYDLMNDLMSAGLHRGWKAYTVLVSGAAVGSRVLDVAGGTGDLADWQMLADFISNQPGRNFILAGGLTPANVAEAIQAVGPCGVDVAGGVESSPRKKDPVLVSRFIAAAVGSSPFSRVSS